MVARLADDHARAAELARGIGRPTPPTNIVLVESADPERVVRGLAERGVLALARPGGAVRFVTHRGIGRGDVRRAVAAAREALGA
jgi:threonine aldolase